MTTEIVAFKSGKDLCFAARTDDEDTVSCEDCAAVESRAAAAGKGWQLNPPVCPDCLRWVATGTARARCM